MGVSQTCKGEKVLLTTTVPEITTTTLETQTRAVITVQGFPRNHWTHPHHTLAAALDSSVAAPKMAIKIHIMTPKQGGQVKKPRCYALKSWTIDSFCSVTLKHSTASWEHIMITLNISIHLSSFIYAHIISLGLQSRISTYFTPKGH